MISDGSWLCVLPDPTFHNDNIMIIIRFPLETEGREVLSHEYEIKGHTTIIFHLK